MKSKYALFFVLLSFFWAGLVCGISFLEGTVKFTAPSLTLPVGLDVGRHVFAMLNKVELVLGTLIFVLLLLAKPSARITVVSSFVLVVLLLQSFWLLPALDQRALTIINGGNPGESSLHAWFIGLELFKLLGLIVTGIMSFITHSRSITMQE